MQFSFELENVHVVPGAHSPQHYEQFVEFKPELSYTFVGVGHVSLGVPVNDNEGDEFKVEVNGH